MESISLSGKDKYGMPIKFSIIKDNVFITSKRMGYANFPGKLVKENDQLYKISFLNEEYIILCENEQFSCNNILFTKNIENVDINGDFIRIK